jgi:GH43 family beta-xylosidase
VSKALKKLTIKQAIAAVLALLTLLLASCDPSGDGNATEAPTESGEVTTPATEDVTTAPDTEAPTETPTEEESEAPTEEETESEAFVMGTMQNPLSANAAADPVVVYHEGYYYATYTEAIGISLFRSKDLKTLLTDEKITVMNLNETVQGNIWAPELHYNPATDRWYIYASGSTNGWDFFTIRMFCLESVTNDPFGEYVFKGFTDPNVLAIDQTVFYDEQNGTLYTAFSQFTDKGQVITLAVMENPWTVSNKRIEVSFPRYEWERLGKTENKDERVNEGPVFLYRNGKLCLFYSASGCWSEYYCLGLLEFTGDDLTEESVMRRANWKKSNKPVFKAANEVYGVGHCFFFDTPDGQTWISYHGMHTPDAGEAGRYMYIQPISFDEKGLPVLGEPLSRDTVIEYPLTKITEAE